MKPIIKKSMLFCLITYLIARLEAALQLSGLSVLKFRPKAQVEALKPQAHPFGEGKWVFSETGDFYLQENQQSETLDVWRLPSRREN